MSLYTSKPLESTSRTIHNVDYGLWVILKSQRWFIGCNTCTPLVGGVDNEGGYAIRELSVPSSIVP